MIVAYNEVDRVERAIRSVADLVDERWSSIPARPTKRVVMRTARRAVVHHPWGGFGRRSASPRKRRATTGSSASTPTNGSPRNWRAELAAILAAPLPPTRCFRARVRVVYPRRETPAPFAHYHKYVRLYNRTTARFRDSLTHDVVEPTADVRAAQRRHSAQELPRLRSHHHQDGQLLPHAARGGDRAEPRRPLALFTEFPYQFFRYYLIRRHIFGGADGFAYAIALSIGRWCGFSS